MPLDGIAYRVTLHPCVRHSRKCRLPLYRVALLYAYGMCREAAPTRRTEEESMTNKCTYSRREALVDMWLCIGVVLGAIVVSLAFLAN